MQQVTRADVQLMFDQVADMNVAFGKKACPLGAYPSLERLKPQVLCIEEEIDELADAFRDSDINLVRDAICDILVFAFGVGHLGGFNAFDGVAGDVDFELEEGGYIRRLRRCYNSMLSTVEAMEQAPEPGFDYSDVFFLTAHTHALVNTALEAALYFGLNLVDDMNSVYESNMTKFCRDLGEIERTIAKYRDIGVTVVPTGEFPRAYVVADREQEDINGKTYPAGKFLKGVGFSEPAFKPNRNPQFLIKSLGYGFRKALM